jgi:hypothetical protein
VLNLAGATRVDADKHGALVMHSALGTTKLVASVLHWRQRLATRLVRPRYSSIVLVALLFTWSLSQFNLLWWHM